jgi:hypothetical protein
MTPRLASLSFASGTQNLYATEVTQDPGLFQGKGPWNRLQYLSLVLEDILFDVFSSISFPTSNKIS